MPITPVIQQSSKVLSYVQVAAGGADAAYSVVPPDGAEYAEIAVSAQAVRWRADGTAPTAAIGMPVPVGQTVVFALQQLSQLKIIAQVAGAALDITFYGR